MKTKLLILLIATASFNAFSQAKIGLANDSLHYLRFSNDMLNQDAAYSGQLIPASPLPSGLNLYLALYSGAGAASLSLQTTYALDAAGMLSEGLFANKNLTLVNVPGGVPAYFQLYFWSSSSPDTLPPAVTGGSDLRSYGTINPFYFGSTGLFTAVPGSSIAYPNICTAASSSTWSPGDVIVYGIPEPSGLALFGLGATLAILRRGRAKCGY